MNLWDADKLQARDDVVLAGETVPALFWNGVAARSARVLMREKKLGLWREWTWAQTAQVCRMVVTARRPLRRTARTLMDCACASRAAACPPRGLHRACL